MKKNQHVLAIVILLSIILVPSCESNKASIANHKEHHIVDSIPPRSDNPPTDTSLSGLKNIESIDTLSESGTPQPASSYSIDVEKIDSAKFFSMKTKIKGKVSPLQRIDDFTEVEKLLRGVVTFKKNDNYQIVTKIVFRNGKRFESGGDILSFVAYFPTEDILLLTGQNEDDVSYNLQNGNGTENTGNLNTIISSPSAQFRINGYYNGEECHSNFIQKKIGNEYTKILQLDVEFEKITNQWLCTIGEAFWLDETTIYLTEKSHEGTNDGVGTQFFKILLSEN